MFRTIILIIVISSCIHTSIYSQVLTLDQITHNYSPTKEITLHFDKKNPKVSIKKALDGNLIFEYKKDSSNDPYYNIHFNKYNTLNQVYSPHSDLKRTYRFKAKNMPIRIENNKECRNILSIKTIDKLTNPRIKKLLDDCDEIYVYFKKKKKEYKVLVDRTI